MQPIYLSAVDVSQLIKWSLVNNAVEEALKAIAFSEPDSMKEHQQQQQQQQQSYVRQPERSFLALDKEYSKLLLTMPGYVVNYKLENENDEKNLIKTLACKLVTSFNGNEKRSPPIPNILAHIILLDSDTGRLQCIMEATQITAWRTAAASIIATKYLYFISNNEDIHRPIKLAIIGCGVQGQSHAFGMCDTFNINEIYLWNRTRLKAENLAEQLKKIYTSNILINITNTPNDALHKADIICVATSSSNALIDYNMLSSSSTKLHINTVGAGHVHYGEVSQDIYDRSVVYVDSINSARIELKGLKCTIIDEVGKVIRTGRRTENERITIFQSMGIAAEDATVAQAIFNAYLRSKNH